MTDSEFGNVNSKFRGGIQTLPGVSIPCFLKRGTLAGGSGAAAPKRRRIAKILQFFKEKI